MYAFQNILTKMLFCHGYRSMDVRLRKKWDLKNVFCHGCTLYNFCVWKYILLYSIEEIVNNDNFLMANAFF